MGAIFGVLIFFAGIALIVCFIAAGAHFLDSREDSLKIRKKRVVALENALNNIEQTARDTLVLDGSHILAHQVLSEVHKLRRKELT